MGTTELANEVAAIPMSELAAYHQQLDDKYSGLNGADVDTNADSTKLMKFNGFYALNTAAGAFFAIDTNVIMNAGTTTPIYDVRLLVSLSGQTSAGFPFTGTFDGTTLVQQSDELGSFAINLTFTRTNGSDGTTATCSGTITLPGQASVPVSGTTYNNPIPANLFAGDFYYIQPDKSTVKVMSIDETGNVMYDYGTNNGTLTAVPAYKYNLNMYFFTFPQGTDTASLVMGTAAVQGFACNNMVVDGSVTKYTRSLLTIPGAAMEPFEFYDISGTELASYSGYYQLSPAGSKAFVSIQAQYATISEALSLDLYLVQISISMDGVNSNGYYYDPTSMTFDGNTLTMNDQHITLTFDRTYDSSTGSLVSLTGSVNGTPVTGATLFNPVPLSVFGGVAMTNANNDSLTVTNDNQVIWNGTVMDSIIYVPLMYILAYPITKTSTVMSFGTNGLKGNACIVTTGIPAAPVVSFVDAIFDAS